MVTWSNVMKKITIIKILLYTILTCFLLLILYMMYLEPYASNSYLFTSEECDSSYDCICFRETDTELWCSCKYKKWFIESKGNCTKKVDDPNVTIVLKSEFYKDKLEMLDD